MVMSWMSDVAYIITIKKTVLKSDLGMYVCDDKRIVCVRKTEREREKLSTLLSLGLFVNKACSMFHGREDLNRWEAFYLFLFFQVFISFSGISSI